ncbi:MAG: DUF4136 domain-containing protein [Flavobacteriaceae bacterium]|nr:DUF4136 domain-containing protein [Flavobacteriaceae bacterium]
MKKFKFLIYTSLVFILLVSCVSVDVTSNYDSKTDFSKYKTFAFYKKGIDKSKISDIDKKRILRAIESELIEKGMTKSSHPDILVSIFTKSQKYVDEYNNMYWHDNYSEYVEGTLFIDLIASKNKTLLWQGVGKGMLNTSKKVKEKEARINEFVAEIMKVYPPSY